MTTDVSGPSVPHLMEMAAAQAPWILGSTDVDERSTSELLGKAAAGDAGAWATIVDTYERLLWSVARGFRYDDATTADVVQTVWLRLAEHCGRIRDPERLSSWLATTCRNECLAAARHRRHEVSDDAVLRLHDASDLRLCAGLDEPTLDRETTREVLSAFTHLSTPCQELLRLLCADPPLDYKTVSTLTGRPVGSIGPTRQRCLAKLREFMEMPDA